MTMAVKETREQTVGHPARTGLVDRFSVVLIAVAAMLWASDTYFRARLVGHLKPAQIVVIEDALVSLFLLAFLIRGVPELRRLDRRGGGGLYLIFLRPPAVPPPPFSPSVLSGAPAPTPSLPSQHTP